MSAGAAISLLMQPRKAARVKAIHRTRLPVHEVDAMETGYAALPLTSTAFKNGLEFGGMQIEFLRIRKLSSFQNSPINLFDVIGDDPAIEWQKAIIHQSERGSSRVEDILFAVAGIPSCKRG
jgi:hypothetical protein